jgi:hypothetical protein
MIQSPRSVNHERFSGILHSGPPSGPRFSLNVASD